MAPEDETDDPSPPQIGPKQDDPQDPPQVEDPSPPQIGPKQDDPVA